ncbi:hypothetical protein TNCV_62061 [Trichonephila clavipes]|nr:hypothetical protein TNCV_62061 [Trichonephila clavipes]
MATANDMDLTQNGIINNVHIPSSPSRFMITDELIYDNQQSVRELINLKDSYAIWARKLSIVPAISDEYTATSAELGNIHTALLAAKERMFRLPISIEALDVLIKKVEKQRTHLTPVDSTPKETVPSDTTLNSPSKRILKNLRLKIDKKRLIDDDGFQTPDKRHTAKKIVKKNLSLPPTTSQTSNPAQAPPQPAESSDSEIEDEDAAGDINAAHKTWNNTRSNNFGFRLKRIIQNYPNARIVAPYIPTHTNSRSRPGVRDSIIDLAVSKNIPFNYDIRVIDDLCSDHLPVILTLYTNSDTMKIPAQLFSNWENFRFLFKNKPLPIPASPSNEHLDVAIG